MKISNEIRSNVNLCVSAKKKSSVCHNRNTRQHIVKENIFGSVGIVEKQELDITCDEEKVVYRYIAEMMLDNELISQREYDILIVNL